MAFRYSSKGRTRRALARGILLAPLIALQVASGAPATAVMLGANPRAAASVMVKAEGDARFEGVGRIECLDPARRGTTYLATGWVLGSADTVVTAAHLFFRGATAQRVLDPSQCVFVLYDRDEKVREIAHIRYAVSPWTDQRFRDDSSYDLAVLKLDRPLKIDNIPSVRVSDATEIRSVDLVAFHTDVADMQRAWISTGRRDIFPVAQLRFDKADLRITSASRLFSTSAASSPGSSGGMYYDERLNAAIGLHVGSLCDQVRPSYDPDICFNYGLRFDAAIVALVDAVVRDQARRNQQIRPGSDPNQLAMIQLGVR